jgi:hypothetical protein
MDKSVTVGLILMMIFMGSFGYYVFPLAFGESVGFIKSQYSDEEIEQCEIRVDAQLLHVPVRFELEFEELPDENALTIITQSALQFEKREDGFVFLTDTIDRHDITIKLDYKDDEPKTREVYYRIYSNSNPVAEGTWLHDTNLFCKTFHFFAQEPPIVYDTSYFEEQFLLVEGKKLQIIIDNQDEAEAFNVIMGVLGMIGAIGAGVMGLYVYINFNDIKRSLARPVKLINESVSGFRKVVENSKLMLGNSELEITKAVAQVITESRELKHESEKLIQIGSQYQKNVVKTESSEQAKKNLTEFPVKVKESDVKSFSPSDKELKEYLDKDKKSKVLDVFPAPVTEFLTKISKPVVKKFVEDKLPEDEKELSKLMVKWERQRLYDTYNKFQKIMVKDNTEGTDTLTAFEKLQCKLAYEILRMKP